MILIDDETFTELTVHLKQASDAMVNAARQLALLSQGDHPSVQHCAGALDDVLVLAIEMVALEALLRALWDANRTEAAAPLASDKKDAPLRS